MRKLAEILGVSTRVVIYTLLTILFLIGLTVSIASVESFVEYSSLPIGLTKAFMGIILLKLVDDTMFGKIDTIPEIVKNKNISYAILYLSIAIIIAAALIAS